MHLQLCVIAILPLMFTIDALPKMLGIQRASSDSEPRVQVPKCTHDEFLCENKLKCVHKYKLCDKNEDCSDGSDELDCRSPCPFGTFKCKDGECVPKNDACNGEYNCKDKSDESPLMCRDNCSFNEFACENKRQCFPQYKLCNRHRDCADGSDEYFSICAVNCDANMFHCANKQECIPMNKTCNNYSDCRDGSDEDYILCGKTCPSDTFACNNKKQCVSTDKVCNTNEDCSDGSDELDCQHLTTVTMQKKPKTTPVPMCESRCERSMPSLIRLRALWARSFERAGEKGVSFEIFLLNMVHITENDDSNRIKLREEILQIVGRFQDCVMACEHQYSKRSAVDRTASQGAICQGLLYRALRSSNVTMSTLAHLCSPREPDKFT